MKGYDELSLEKLREVLREKQDKFEKFYKENGLINNEREILDIVLDISYIQELIIGRQDDILEKKGEYKWLQNK